MTRTMMRPAARLLLLSVALGPAALGGCAGTEPTAASALLPVVQAYLYAGEPVRDVRITSTFGISGDDTTGVPVLDATVSLRRGGTTFVLVASPGDSGYYHYDGSDLVIASGDTFDLEVTALGRSLSARTIVPQPPATLSLSRTVLRIPSFGSGPPSGGFNPEEMMLVVRWPNTSGELFFVATENIETAPTEIDLPFGGFRFRSPPTSADSAVVIGFTLTEYGRHRLTLFRVNSEYAALYESRSQDSRDLNEPATNIHGGLGVFTAFASRSADFIVQ